MSIGDYPLRKYGSQGQQKSFLVALKLAQYDIVAARCGSRADPAAGRHIRQARPATGRRADPHRSRQAVRPNTDYGLQPDAARRHIARKRVRVQAVPGIRRNRGGIMRRRDPVRICDALNDFFSSTPVIARKIAEAKSRPVARSGGKRHRLLYDENRASDGGRLFVHLSSSVARNEVFMRRSALMDAINEASASGSYRPSSSNSFSPARTQNAMPFGPRSAPRGRGSSAVKNGPCRKERSCTVRKKRSAGTGPCPKACPESRRPYHFSSIREA